MRILTLYFLLPQGLPSCGLELVESELDGSDASCGQRKTTWHPVGGQNVRRALCSVSSRTIPRWEVGRRESTGSINCVTIILITVIFTHFIAYSCIFFQEVLNLLLVSTFVSNKSNCPWPRLFYVFFACWPDLLTKGLGFVKPFPFSIYLLTCGKLL